MLKSGLNNWARYTSKTTLPRDLHSKAPCTKAAALGPIPPGPFQAYTIGRGLRKVATGVATRRVKSGQNGVRKCRKKEFHVATSRNRNALKVLIFQGVNLLQLVAGAGFEPATFGL